MAKRKKKDPEPVTVEPEKKPLPWKWIVLVLVLILGVAGFLFWKPEQKGTQSPSATGENPKAILKQLAQLDFKGREPQVVEKIKQLILDVENNKSSAHSWGKLAMNLDIHDFKKESVPCYKEAIRLNPEDFRWPYYCGIVLQDLGSPEAIPLFSQSVRLKPNYTPAHIRYGQSLLEAKRNSEATQAFQQALTINENSAHAHFGLAQIFLAQNDLNSCLSHLGKALKTNPQFAEAHALAAEVFRRGNRTEDATRHQSVAQQLPKKTAMPDEVFLDLINEGVSSYWYDARGRAYLQQKAYDDAIRELKQAVAIAPEPRLHNTLGAAYLSMGKFEEALAQHRQAYALNPKSVPTMNNLASALYEVGKTEEAFQHLKKAIETEPGKPYSYLHLTKLYTRSGKTAEAIETLRLAGKRIPTSPQIAIQLAWLLATAKESSLRNGVEAVQLADNVCKISNYRDPEALDVLSAAFAEVGRFDLAKESAKKAIELARDPEISGKIQSHLKLYEAGKPYHE